MIVKGKKAVVFGVANERSIAWAIAQELKKNGAQVALSYLNPALQKRVDPLAKQLGADFTFQCDLSNDAEIQAAAKTVEEKWGKIDILMHAVAFAQREDLQGRFLDTSREGFKIALDISAYSLVAMCKAFENVLNDGAAIGTMTYHGSTKVITNYNVMGVAKAALEAGTRYLAAELGPRNIRVNAISAGPIKTLSSSAVSGLKSSLSAFAEKSPLKRNVMQEEVGKTALYLLSDLASGVTGETHYVDCGYNIMG